MGKPKLQKLRRIAIDEIAVRKGHHYPTLVLDLESGRVVFVGNGKGADALELFWKRLRRSRAKIEAVATDMSWAYIFAVTENLPQAAIVCDRFHAIKLLNDKLTDLRRELYRTTKDVLSRLANTLGLSVPSLRRLGIGWSQEHRAWTFPMTDAGESWPLLAKHTPEDSNL